MAGQYDRPSVDVTQDGLAAEWLRKEIGRGLLSGMFRRADNIVHTPRIDEDGTSHPVATTTTAPVRSALSPRQHSWHASNTATTWFATGGAEWKSRPPSPAMSPGNCWPYPQEHISGINDRVWIFTGNNMSVGGDMPRRTLWVTIDPQTPHPEDRTDFTIPRPLNLWVAVHRGEILHALLVLVRAWVCAGRQTELQGSDDYAPWIATVRAS